MKFTPTELTEFNTDGSKYECVCLHEVSIDKDHDLVFKITFSVQQILF